MLNENCYSHNPKCVCMCMCTLYTSLHSSYRAGYCMLLSLALYFDNAPSLTLASFLCAESTRPPGRPDPAGMPIEQAGSRSTARRTAQSPQPAWLAHQCLHRQRLNILKRTQVNPLYLSRNNPIACTPTRPIGQGPELNPGHHGWPVCTAASGLTH